MRIRDFLLLIVAATVFLAVRATDSDEETQPTPTTESSTNDEGSLENDDELPMVAIDPPREPEPATGEPKVELEAKCKQSVDVGNGTEQMERFFFDVEEQNCKTFNYTGDGGNENNFESELDCLNDCFVGVRSTEIEGPKEEDVVFVAHDSPAPDWACDKPKDPGTGNDTLLRFFYKPEWRSCFGFTYKGEGGNNNRFESRADCESTCSFADGSVCIGPTPSGDFIKRGRYCDTSKCGKGFKCVYGMGFPECCDLKELEEVEAAYSETCPDGSPADGVFRDIFQATFAESCDDLVCPAGMKCQQVNKVFAKCCGEKRLADEIPVSAGALHVRIDGEHPSSRLAFPN